MIHNLSLVHVFLALGAAACIYLVVRELRGAYVSQLSLFVPGLAALFVAGGLFLIQIAAGQPRWMFGIAAGAGLVIGAVRGTTIHLQHDLYRPQVLISQNAKLVLLAVALGLGLCTAVEIAGSFVTDPEAEVASLTVAKLRLWAALCAMVGATAMLARALALAIRLRRGG